MQQICANPIVEAIHELPLQLDWHKFVIRSIFNIKFTLLKSLLNFTNIETMNFSKFFILFVLAISLQISLVAQNWVSHVSQSQVNELLDNGTELLMVTDAGLVVMNKMTLEKTIFTKTNTSILDHRLEQIVEAPNGAIWVVTHNAVAWRFDGTDFQDMTIPASPEYDSDAELFGFDIAPNGDFWFATKEGVFHQEGTSWNFYGTNVFGADFFEAWDVIVADNGDVFVAAIDLFRFSNGVWFDILLGSNLQNYLHSDLFIASDGDLYMAGDLDEIGHFDGSTWQEYSLSGLPLTSNFFTGSQVKGITEDQAGDIYIQTQNDGIFKLTGTTWTPQTDAETTLLSTNYASYFYIDAQDRRWLNYNIHLTVNDGGTIQSTLISETTLESNAVENIHKGANGHLFFITGSYDNISVKAPDGTWSLLPYPSTLALFEFKYDFLYLAADDIWMATNNGLHHYDGTAWTLNPLGFCRSFTVDSQGKIYVRGNGTIYIFDNGTMTEINASNSIIDPISNITGHGVDANDNLWIAERELGVTNGVNNVHKVAPDGTWTTYSSAAHPNITKTVGAFHFDVNGNVWIADDAYGVIKFDGTNWSKPLNGNGGAISDGNVDAIESDADGTVYFANSDGVTTITNGVLGEMLIPDLPEVPFSSTSDIIFDNAGTLWWANSSKGVQSLNLSGAIASELSIKVYLEGAYEDNNMRTELTNLLPMTQPYNMAPWFYSGTESLTAVPTDMVDWILVEARTGTPNLSGAAGTTVVETLVGILLETGDVVGTDGTPLRFTNLVQGNDYHFGIRHRNHLSVLTNTAITASPQMSYDFTTDVDMAFGVDQQKMTSNGKAVVFAGNANGDNVIQTTDYDSWSQQPAAINVYQSTDFNLDGIIQATDYDQWFVNKAKLGIGEF